MILLAKLGIGVLGTALIGGALVTGSGLTFVRIFTWGAAQRLPAQSNDRIKVVVPFTA